VESSRVYVGNLSYDVTEQDLQELFKGVGPVRTVEIVYNRSTHRSKGYGFVEMLRRDEAVRAVEVLHDQFFMGRKMNVSGAKSKGQDERDDQDDVRSEPKPVVLAPTTPPAVAEQLEAETEPGLSETSDPTGNAVGEEVANVSASDLEAKYGFGEEPKSDEKPGEEA
jgi:RNA recognition motif-containing protein